MLSRPATLPPPSPTRPKKRGDREFFTWRGTFEWGIINDMPTFQLVTKLPNASKTDRSFVVRCDYRCPKDTKVALFRIVGGGHTWPGGGRRLPKAVIGRVNRDIMRPVPRYIVWVTCNM